MVDHGKYAVERVFSFEHLQHARTRTHAQGGNSLSLLRTARTEKSITLH